MVVGGAAAIASVWMIGGVVAERPEPKPAPVEQSALLGKGGLVGELFSRAGIRW